MKKARVPWIICLWMFVTALQLNAQQKRPNILVIFGDDVGYWNVSEPMEFSARRTHLLCAQRACLPRFYFVSG